MKHSLLTVAGLAIAATAISAPAQHAQKTAPAAPRATQSTQQQAVNTHCPIGREPIDGRTFITYEGSIIGFCCPGCDEAFLGWDKERRGGFVRRAKAGPEEAVSEPRTERPAPASGSLAALYPLSACPVSGQQLGSMGEPVVKTYDGREVRFCCPPCVPTFEDDKASYLKKIDEQIIATQLPYYPLDTCIVAGGKLGSMGEPDDFVYQNRLVRFCCAACRARFENDAVNYISKLDKAAADQQRDDYPLQTCIVRGARLGSMGDPVEVIIAGRLIRLCCPPCESRLREEPAKFVVQIDELWRAARKPGALTPEGGR